MEVIACIPELSPTDVPDDARLLAGDPAVEVAAPRSPAAGPAVVVAMPGTADGTSRQPRGQGAVRRRARPFPGPSVVVLAVVAAAVWTAAWRSERLRAIEQQRPQRVAMEPVASAGSERSLTP